MASGWLTRSLADVPAGDAWLGERERRVLAGLRIAKRRADWRLGRYAAKAALGADVEILAAPDGAPEAWRGPARLPLSVSLSHRDGLALVAVGDPPAVVGCDLERLEPRSEAFVRDWLAPAEQALAAGDPVRVPNLVWAAKEAAAKVRREGLRLAVRQAVVSLQDGGEWAPFSVEWTGEGLVTHGWWREAGGFVMTVACSPGAAAPVRLPDARNRRAESVEARSLRRSHPG